MDEAECRMKPAPGDTRDRRIGVRATAQHCSPKSYVGRLGRLEGSEPPGGAVNPLPHSPSRYLDFLTRVASFFDLRVGMVRRSSHVCSWDDVEALIDLDAAEEQPGVGGVPCHTICKGTGCRSGEGRLQASFGACGAVSKVATTSASKDPCLGVQLRGRGIAARATPAEALQTWACQGPRPSTGESCTHLRLTRAGGPTARGRVVDRGQASPPGKRSREH